MMPDIIQRLCDTYAENPAAALKLIPEVLQAHDEELIKVLPCKVGIDVYAVIGKKIRTCVCIGWNWNGGSLYMLCMDRETGQNYSFFDFHFTGKLTGTKTVYSTREAAEKALERKL